MSELYLMATITDRENWKRFRNFYRAFGLEITLSTVAEGTEL